VKYGFVSSMDGAISWFLLDTNFGVCYWLHRKEVDREILGLLPCWYLAGDPVADHACVNEQDTWGMRDDF
jgi:hypothetical protein